MHAHIEQSTGGGAPCAAPAAAAGQCFGGHGRLSTALQQMRARAQREGAAFKFLNVGDEFTGTLWVHLAAARWPCP